MHLNLIDRKLKLTNEIATLEKRLQDLTMERETLQAKLNSARGGLLVLGELEAEQASQNSRNSPDKLLKIPAIRLADAVQKAAVALKKFTREDLAQWIRANYPQLQFSNKSVDRPIRDLMAVGEVLLLRRNTGNKIPAVYGLKGSRVE